MTVSLRNTPLVAVSNGTLTPSVAATYNGTSPVAYDLLVAVLTLQANATATLANLGAAPSGWQLTSVQETVTGCTTVVYQKVAAGSDAAPTFTATLTSTAADCGAQAIIYDFYDSSGVTPQLTAWGIATGTSGTVTPVTNTLVPAGSYAIAALSMYASTAAAPTWTTPSGWSSNGDSSVSNHYQYAFWSKSAPAAGSTLSVALAHTVITSTHESGIVAVISPPGPLDFFQIHNTGKTSLTWTHNARAGLGGMLFVGANIDAGSDTSILASATCDGATLIPLGREETSAGGGNGYVSSWQSPSPVAAGSHTIVVTVTGGTPTDIIGFSASNPGSVSLGLVQVSNDASTLFGIVVPGQTSGDIVAGFVSPGASIGALTSPGATSLFTDNLEGSGPDSTGNMAAAYAIVGFTGTGAVHASSGPCHSGYAYLPAGSRVLHPAGSSTVVPAVVQAPVVQPAALYRADAGATLPKGASGPTTVSWTNPGGSWASMGVEFIQPGPIQILTTVVPEAYVDYSYTTTLAAQGGTQTGYTWSVVSGSLPSWASLNPATGTIYGYPPSGSSGSSTFTVQVTDSGSNTDTQILTLNCTIFSGSPYITGIVTDPVNGGYFTDQLGLPLFCLSDNVWALPFNAGEWSSGAWMTDMTTYLSDKQTQKYTAIYVSALGNIDNDGSYKNGNTWDNIPPWNGGSAPAGTPDQGFNPSYWARVDYLIAEAANYGITVFLNIAYTAQSSGNGTLDPGAALYDLTPSQYFDYGYQLGQRYGASPNLVWMYGNDYYNSGPTADDAAFGYIRSGILATGDSHVQATHNYPESTERYDVETLTGPQILSLFSYYKGQINFVYSYNALYYGTELAYEEPANHPGITELPVMWGDGLFGMTGSYDFASQMRQMLWWAVASGCRGVTATSNNVWGWQSVSAGDAVTDYPYPFAGNIRAVLESLPDWWQLVPDTGSVLVTAGRGTHATGLTTGSNFTFGSDNYVAASKTPNSGSGSVLAVIYCAKAMSITISQAQMAPGYQAYWVDPASGVKTLTTSGSTYSSSGLGNNSAGHPDWVLVLQAPQPGSQVVQAALPPPKTALSQFIPPQVITGTGATIIPVAQADTAAQADAVAVAAAVPVADVAGQADAVTVSAAVPLADVAGAADGIAVTVAVPLADTAGAADAETTPLTGNTLTVLTAAVLQRPPPPPPVPAQVLYEVTQPPQTVTQADVAAGTDQVTAAAAVPLSDVAAAADAIAVTAAVPLADVAGHADTETTTLTGSTLTALVAAPPPPPPVPRPVPPQVIPGVYQAPGAISQPDTAGAADTLTVAVALSVADVAGEADTWLAGIATAEADTAGATDAVTVTVAVPLPDTGGAADTVTVAAAVPVADTGGAADSESVLTAAGPSPVVITALPAYPPRLPPLAPQIIGIRTGGPASVTQADVAAGADSLTVSAAVPVTDTGAELDAFSNGQAGPLAADLLGGTLTTSTALHAGSITFAPYSGTITGGNVATQVDISGPNAAIVNNDTYVYLAITYNGSPLNLAGYTIKAYLKAAKNTPDADATVFTTSSGLTVTNAATGSVTWDVARTNLPNPAGLWYRVDVIDSSGEVFTSLFGNFTVLPA